MEDVSRDDRYVIVPMEEYQYFKHIAACDADEHGDPRVFAEHEFAVLRLNPELARQTAEKEDAIFNLKRDLMARVDKLIQSGAIVYLKLCYASELRYQRVRIVDRDDPIVRLIDEEGAVKPANYFIDFDCGFQFVDSRDKHEYRVDFEYLNESLPKEAIKTTDKNGVLVYVVRI